MYQQQISRFILLFLCITSICTYNVSAQSALYNLNIRNGLPTNHIYRTIVDHHGYLWIATDKGVVKYNGYTSKVFDASSGLANDDVWGLYEDTKGRVWLLSISSQLGYIYKDKYTKTFFKDLTDIYPSDFISYDKGIILLTGNRQGEEYLSFEKNDTIKTFKLSGNFSGDSMTLKRTKNNLNQVYGLLKIYDRSIYSEQYEKNRIKYKKIGRTNNNYNFFVGNLIIPERKEFTSDTSIPIINIARNIHTQLSLDSDEELIVPIWTDNGYYVTTTKQIYKLDENLHVIDIVTPGSIKNNDISDGIALVTFTDNDLWQRCIATSNNGLFIGLRKNNFSKSNAPFAKDKYVGNYRDSIFYWWNVKNKTLSLFTTEKRLSVNKYPELHDIHKIVALTSNKFLVLNNRDLFLIQGNKLSKYYSSNLVPYHYIRGKYALRAVQYGKDVVGTPVKMNDCIVDSDDKIHSATMANKYIIQYAKDDKIISNVIDSSRYEEILFHSKLNAFILKGKNVMFINHGQQYVKLNEAILSSLGIKNIQHIVLDTFGNIYIKTYNKLFSYNPFKRKLKSLFNRYNLNNAHLIIKDNKIVVVGRFGVVYSKLNSDGLLSQVKDIINFKAQNYFDVNDSYLFGDTLFISTDRAFYSVYLSNNLYNTDRNNQVGLRYKLFVKTNNKNGITHTGDSLLIDQKNPVLDFDFINPYGDGSVKYTYTVNEKTMPEWVLANRVDLPSLSPGLYYKVQLVVSDESWKTSRYTFYVCIKPYWWQTGTGKTWVFFLSTLCLIGLSITIVLVTRQVLNKRHAKENKYLELELRSIYAQLNPHFIFNTLSNIIYYIKKNKNQEAHKYLNTFSKLLRSYIKSSRNKWLPLTEEIENIENYIILQQSRFENKFDYAISIDEELDTENIQLPSLLLQPLVENAIHHGLQQKDEKGILTLSFKKTINDNTILIVIEDDGIGRAAAKQFANNSVNKKESFGSNLLEDLITIYKRYELFSIDINYYDKTEPLTGTIVTLTIKYEP
jgi:hypothetical protein